jgi:RHS repeat-associated protein
VFAYDALNRVTAQKTMAADFTETLRYDPLGNWLCHSNAARGSVDRTVNPANEYVRVGQALLEYDRNGSLTNWNGCGYRYDFLSRLVEVRSNGMTLVRYAYDARNRRVSREGAGGTTAWVYDGDNLVEEYNGGVRGNAMLYADTPDTPVVLWRGGATCYVLRDWRANIAALTDAAGRPVETYRYSLFGVMEIRDGDGIVLPDSRLGNVWTYAGRQRDPETGLLHCRNRVYSPELGRFLQRDPAGYVDGLNLYAYAGNNPLMFSDPYGLYRWSHGALDSRVGEWLFQQFGQLREIERQRREYEEALRRAEEERQRIQRQNEYAARALRDYKAAHPNEVRDMVGRYRHLGVNEDEATRMLMSGITSIPRLGATVGPNDLRRDWWLDYYLRGGQINKTMRDEMTIMGARSVDEYFVKTSEKETRLHDKRKAKQQQYSMAAVAIVATVVTCGAGGAVGAALLGTVGVTASTVSFGAFVAGAVAIQGVAAAVNTSISHGNIGDFTQSWAINSAAGVAGYGAGFGAAKAGLDVNVQLATQSATTTFVAEGGRTAVDGGGFKTVFRDAAISFVVGGIMGTYMAPSGGSTAPGEFGEYVARESLSRFGVLQAPLAGGLQGTLHAAVYGGNMGEAFLEHSVSGEALRQFAMASVVAPVASWITGELAGALPGTPSGVRSEPAYRTPPADAAANAAPAVRPVDTPSQGWGVRLARGSAFTVAEHVYEMTVAPARAISAMLATATASSWRERSRLVNPFSRSFAGYQLLDGATDAAQVAAGLPISFLSGDFMETQSAAGMRFEAGRSLVGFNGIFNDADSAAAMKATLARQFGVDELTQVSNGTHGYVLGDVLQILGNELGAVDITAIRGAQALRLAARQPGTIQVVAHSQGTMTFRRALDLVDDPVLRQRIAYHGAGPEMFIDQRALGLASAENFRNRDQDHLLGSDPVALANILPSPGRWLTAPFGPVGQGGWLVVDSPGNEGAVTGNGHEFNRYYSGYIHGE